VPAGFAVNPNFAVVVPFMCHPDEETAIERGIDGAHFFGYSLAHYYVFGHHRPSRTNVWEEFEQYRHERGFARDIIRATRRPLDIKVLEGAVGSLRGAVGTPEQIADLCGRYEAAGVDQVIFVGQAGRNRHEHICESIELFASDVLPRFAERREAKEAAKRERLAGAVERALARRPSPETRSIENYVISTTGELTPARAPRRGQHAGRTRRFDVQRNVQSGVRRAIGSFVNHAPEGLVRRMADSPVAIAGYRWGMEQRLRDAKLGKANAVIRIEITDGDDAHAWDVIVRDGAATTASPNGVEPEAVVRVDVVDWLTLLAGTAGGGELLFDGRLVIEGDEAKAITVLVQLDADHQLF
jgi:predicted lipid carrier protein YhbT